MSKMMKIMATMKNRTGNRVVEPVSEAMPDS